MNSAPIGKIPYQIVAIPALMLVAGCSSTGSGSGGGGTPPAPGDPAFYAVDVGTMQQALDAGHEMAAHDEAMATFMMSDQIANQRYDGGFVDFALLRNDDGSYTITIDDKSITYAEDDADPYDDGGNFTDSGFESDDGNNNVYNHAATLEEFVTGSGGPEYMSVWRYFWQDEPGTDYTGMAIIGAETRAQDVAEQANATYSGYSEFSMFSTADPDDWDRTNISGDFDLTADFAAGSISGGMSNLERRDRVGGVNGAPSAINGAVAFENGTISGNSFTGGLSFSAFDANDIFGTDPNTYGGEYAGKFYGPDADEVGGMVTIDGTGVIGNGFFAADKD